MSIHFFCCAPLIFPCSFRMAPSWLDIFHPQFFQLQFLEWNLANVRFGLQNANAWQAQVQFSMHFDFFVRLVKLSFSWQLQYISKILIPTGHRQVFQLCSFEQVLLVAKGTCFSTGFMVLFP